MLVQRVSPFRAMWNIITAPPRHGFNQSQNISPRFVLYNPVDDSEAERSVDRENRRGRLMVAAYLVSIMSRFRDSWQPPLSILHFYINTRRQCSGRSLISFPLRGECLMRSTCSSWARLGSNTDLGQASALHRESAPNGSR